jgi:acyl-CoA thioesterase-1
MVVPRKFRRNPSGTKDVRFEVLSKQISSRRRQFEPTMNRINITLASAACTALLSGCIIGSKPLPGQQIGESVVCIGEEPAALARLPLRNLPLRVRSTYLPSAATIEYIQGRDFIVDYSKGTISRTPESRVPDFRTNMLYGREEFDHSAFPGYGNKGFFAYVDYSFAPSAAWPVQQDQTALLPRSRAKLAEGQALKIVAFGDSITAGADAAAPSRVFWNLWAADLRRKYPRARIEVRNGATGGDTTAQGLQRLQAKVLDESPDLVLIGFGMNDHNRNSIPVPRFEENLKQMIARIRRETAAEVILYSAFPPNPKWKFGSHHMADYAAATERVAREVSCAYADVFTNWQTMAARKKPEDLLANDINHPNEFGHWIYYRVFWAMGL